MKMRLAIFSDCVHMKDNAGNVGSDIHIFVKQIEALSIYFSEIHLFCPFVGFDNSIAITTYSTKNIHFYPQKKVGGSTFKHKLSIIQQIPNWFASYRKANQLADIVYQRYPNNINLPGFFYFYFLRKKVFATFTGTWGKNNIESYTYRLQKWMLKNLFRGPVGVYSNEEINSKKIFKSFSPSYSASEWQEEELQTECRLTEIKQNGFQKISMVTVGSFVSYKNQQYILDTCCQLKNLEIPFELYMVGDGELRNQYENFIAKHQLQNEVKLTGKITNNEVRKIYRKVNFVVQSPSYEGFGKVPLEAYFHGALPIINNITLAPYITQNGSLGVTFSIDDKDGLLNVLKHLKKNPNEVIDRIRRSREFVKEFTLEKWAESYITKINEFYNS